MHDLHSLLNFGLYDLVLLGAAVLVVVSTAAEDILALVRGRAVKSVVPLAQGVLVARAVLTPED
jgi:hypothetical protein